MIYHGQELNPNLDGLAEDVQDAISTLISRIPSEYDGIVVQGMSGVIPAVPVSLALRVPLVIVRKPSDDSHLSDHINFDLVKPGSRWVFLDDFISMGTTRLRVQKALKAKDAQVAAQYMCRDGEFRTLGAYQGPSETELPNVNDPDCIPF